MSYINPYGGKVQVAFEGGLLSEFVTMKHLDEALNDADLQKKASRAQFIIYMLMFLFMMLPFLAVWLTGALRF